MKLLVLGATGPTGKHVVERALELGDEVTVLVRRPEALEGSTGRVAVVKGDATSFEAVDRAMSGQDAVISALGRSTSFRADGLFTRSAAAVVPAMRKAGVQRLVWLSSFGVGDTFASASFVQKLLYRSFLRDIYANKAESEKALRSSGLDCLINAGISLPDFYVADSY